MARAAEPGSNPTVGGWNSSVCSVLGWNSSVDSVLGWNSSVSSVLGWNSSVSSVLGWNSSVCSVLGWNSSVCSVLGLLTLCDAASLVRSSSEALVEGIFPLELTWVRTLFPKTPLDESVN